MDRVKDDYAQLSDVRLHYVEDGEGPLVVLLHGFPDFWYSWRHQIPALSAAGYRVVAPDMRGYNLSDKPANIGEYALDRLATDIAELVVTVGGGKAAAVAGHDWGGVVAWAVAAWHPDLVQRLVILNAPHPDDYGPGLRRPRQFLKSWYTGFFQLPLAPASLRAGGFAALRRAVTGSSSKGAFTDEDLARYVEAWSQPRALRSGLAYYRAASRRVLSRRAERLPRVDAPVLVLWGEKDVALEPFFATPRSDLASDVSTELIPEATHWVHLDRPARVNELMLDFLSAPE